MKEENNPTVSRGPKPGFFKRLLDKLDRSLKSKAEARAQQGCCGGSASDGDKGKKCC